jgi:ferredoxin-NADP reductase
MVARIVCSLLALSSAAASAFVSPQFVAPASRVVLRAEGKAPKYDKRPASIVSNTEVGKGSNLIRVKAEDDTPVDYQPGHVLALEIPHPTEEGKWMPAPYTVSRADETSFEVLLKIVGEKSETYREAKVGSALQFGGKFKVPILEGINQGDGLKRVVGISTGVGIGPFMGFSEDALSQTDIPRIDLFAGYREQEDICSAKELDELVEKYPGRFSWTPVISTVNGHSSSPENLKLIAEGMPNAGETHYHMIGNGAMVNEWKAGLEAAGVADERVTLEMYFNHREAARPEAVEAIGEALKEKVLAA